MEDFLYKFLALYNHLPLSIKQVLGNIYRAIPSRVKYGSFYHVYKKRLKFFSRLGDVTQIEKEQENVLIKQVNFAIEKSPFYSGYRPMTEMEGLRKYPVINKQTILDHYEEFPVPGTEQKRIKANTGGSSGNPMRFYIEKDVSRPKEKAHFEWYWGQYGYEPNDKTLMVRGSPLTNDRILEYRTIDNILNVSCYTINEDNIQQVLKEMNAFRPKFIHAYPSSLKVITSLLEPHRQQISFSPKALFLGSEQLSDDDRKRFEDFYKAPVANWYGHSERLIFGGNCPFTNEYHFYPAYGYMELLDEEGSVISSPGQEGRIVATGFDNKIMPFIRYDTGDRGVLSEKRDCRCGFRGVSLKYISGRGQDVIVLSDGTKVSLTAFIFGQHLRAFEKIREMQVIQSDKGKVELCVVKGNNFSLKDEQELIDTLQTSVKNRVSVTISYISSVPKTARGKNIFFVSRLKT